MLTMTSAFVAKSQTGIIGIWQPEEADSKIEITALSETNFIGKVAWLQEPLDKDGKPFLDKKNKKKSLRTREILGMPILEDLVYKEGKWKGTVYAAKRGRKTDVSLSMEGDDKLILTVSMMGMTRKQIWNRSNL